MPCLHFHHSNFLILLRDLVSEGGKVFVCLCSPTGSWRSNRFCAKTTACISSTTSFNGHKYSMFSQLSSCCLLFLWQLVCKQNFQKCDDALLKSFLGHHLNTTAALLQWGSNLLCPVRECKYRKKGADASKVGPLKRFETRAKRRTTHLVD